MAGRFALGRRLEGPLFQLAGVRPNEEAGWLRYALGLLVFNGLGVLAVYALQRWQAVLPFNPQGMPAVAPDSAFNTAISFVTNTNWQGYGGESTMSYLTQMLALTVQNFLSAATGLVVVIALVRGFSRHSAQSIGNVWADLTRATLWVLLPLSLVLVVVFAGQGVIQNLSPSTQVQTLEPVRYDTPELDAGGRMCAHPALRGQRLVAPDRCPCQPGARQGELRAGGGHRYRRDQLRQRPQLHHPGARS